MNFKSFIRRPLICIGIAAATPVASALPFAKFDGPIAQELLQVRQDLNLTRNQKSQIRQVLMDYKDEIKAQRATGQQARNRMKTASETYGPDSKEANTAADGIASAAKSRALLVAVIFSEIRPILSPEQIKTLEDARTSFLSKGL